MELMPQDDPGKLCQRALEALSAGDPQAALPLLERAFKVQDNQALHSYLGYCIAKERGQVRKGRDLCHASLEVEPQNPAHHLNLAKVHQIAGQKPEAIAALRKGMETGGSPEILALLNQLGTRKPPPIRFLSRDNPLNKWIGIALGRIGLR